MQVVGKKFVKQLLRKKFTRLHIDDTLLKVFMVFDTTDLNIIPVFKGDSFIGEIHQIDLLKMVVNPSKIKQSEILELGFGVDFGYCAKKASDIMTTHEIELEQEDLIEDAAYIMLKEDVKCIPVRSGKEFIGILTEHDIIDDIVKRGKVKEWNS